MKKDEKNIWIPKIKLQLASITCGINTSEFKLPKEVSFQDTNEIIDNTIPMIINNKPNSTNFIVDVFIINVVNLFNLLIILIL